MSTKLPYKKEFIIHLKSSNYSVKTTKSYLRDLCYFESFLIYKALDFLNLKKINITEYKAVLKTEEHINLLENVRNLELEFNQDSNTRKRTIQRGINNQLESTEGLKNDFRGSEESSFYINENNDNNYHQNGGIVDQLSTQSINRMLSALRSYLKFLEEFDYNSPLSSDAVKLLKKEKKESQVAEFDELIKLIEAPNQFEKIEEIKLRNRAMLELLFSTGMRISELMRLNREQVTLGKEDANVGVSRIYILGKGKKQRFVYLTDRAKLHLQEYLKLRDDKLPALFIQYRNRSKPVDATRNYRLTVDYLQKKIVEYRKLLGIIVPTSAHSLRHGFATYLIEQGANSAAVQILLGHESLATTTRYVHASDRFAEETHKRFHPLN
ncbi:tyrosine-type recombinase/integrase [bacterium]|nr:MAG: tyrosine-type recombinase/integrase [bacterium]